MKEVFNVPKLDTLVANAATLATTTPEIRDVVRLSFEMIRDYPEELEELLQETALKLDEHSDDDLRVLRLRILFACLVAAAVTYQRVEICQHGMIHVVYPGRECSEDERDESGG